VGVGWLECGYRYVSVDGEKIAEHRRIAEEREGRKLTNDEVVHHVNGDKLDNRAENLLVVTRAEHRRLHSGARRKRWTAAEKNRAKELKASGMSTQDVARTLGRSVSSTITYACNRRK
jgi:HNH endonuclease